MHLCPRTESEEWKTLFLWCVDDRVVARHVEPQQIPRLLHMRRQRRGHIDRPLARMRHDNAARQKMQSVLQSARQFPILLREIFGITDDGVSDMRHVRAQLMGSAGDRL
jgi:hypothetical protein